ncbi:hypothetical protein N665_0041s0010 [Sinapis alba]|nr:hypothetical protein N665_0041s0010 [Sinapis alba]
MAMEKDNDHASNVAVTAEQATKINVAHVRLLEHHQTIVVSETGSVSKKGEEGTETEVAVAVAVDD